MAFDIPCGYPARVTIDGNNVKVNFREGDSEYNMEYPNALVNIASTNGMTYLSPETIAALTRLEHIEQDLKIKTKQVQEKTKELEVLYKEEARLKALTAPRLYEPKLPDVTEGIVRQWLETKQARRNFHPMHLPSLGDDVLESIFKAFTDEIDGLRRFVAYLELESGHWETAEKERAFWLSRLHYFCIVGAYRTGLAKPYHAYIEVARKIRQCLEEKKWLGPLPSEEDPPPISTLTREIEEIVGRPIEPTSNDINWRQLDEAGTSDD